MVSTKLKLQSIIDQLLSEEIFTEVTHATYFTSIQNLVKSFFLN